MVGGQTEFGRIKLSCSGSQETNAVLQEIVAFLDTLREIPEGRQISLTLDVTAMPLIIDTKFVSDLSFELGKYSDLFHKISCLSIVVSHGVQEMLVRASVAFLPQDIAVNVCVENYFAAHRDP